MRKPPASGDRHRAEVAKLEASRKNLCGRPCERPVADDAAHAIMTAHSAYVPNSRLFNPLVGRPAFADDPAIMAGWPG